MSEALADLARLTGDASWLRTAAMFERPCFVRRDAPEICAKMRAGMCAPTRRRALVRPLMLAGRLGARAFSRPGGIAETNPEVPADAAVAAAGAIEKVHANAHLPQLLGMMARCYMRDFAERS